MDSIFSNDQYYYNEEEDYPEEDLTPNFYDWKDIFPQLKVLIDSIDIIKEEAKNIKNWVPWPEDHYVEESNKEWTVFPLLYTFPANDPSSMKRVESACAICPQTIKILEKIEGIRTILFSSLGPDTELSSHTGWADLANYVLRCHLCLDIPEVNKCGMLVNGEIQYHSQDSILVFDDSKPHRAFNFSDKNRVVLIFDIIRPSYLAEGKAVGGHTNELDRFIDWFK